jgi:DNA invertase Pin-like site-specific DNA recombinase
MRPHPTKLLRCAIYTRVSTEHGLDQEFNSLDNQREAAEAYIKSQAHEGWRLIANRYDDGGYSGGTMDRPGLQQLLADVRAGLIDTVVVYKVDRLTRALADFAKLVELFDEHGVCFVSVTQAFNTTTSMGRLTLNVLLSFAQFEREVTGERIRDKIAASKRKGMWMGGHAALGYRVANRKLIIDPDEATTVRLIFERYLVLGSLPALQRELRERGVVTRARHRASGEVVGGGPFTNGPLAHLLRNRIYLGEINHRGASHPGEHEPIIDPELFAAVQEMLNTNHNPQRLRLGASEALLLGRLYDDQGNRMTPTHANKKGARYRYYTSCVLAQGRKEQAGSIARISAPDLEAAVVEALRREIAADCDPTRIPELSDAELIAQQLDSVVLRQGEVEIRRSAPGSAPIILPWSPVAKRKRREITHPTGSDLEERPIRAEARARLVAGIAKARRWLDQLVAGAVADTRELAKQEGCSERSVRMTLNLAFLDPALVKAAVAGTLPHGPGITGLCDAPLAWKQLRGS